uniref:Uncharacterized protein n=1 Tax=Arundo donax TaxID=35708 RepID=A0A0A8Y009_ARUDO
MGKTAFETTSWSYLDGNVEFMGQFRV